MLLKFPPKFLGFAGLRENAHQFLPIYTTFGEEPLFEIQTAEQSRTEVFMGHFSRAVSWSGDYGISLPFSFLLIFLQNYFESFLTILDYFVSF